MERLFFYSPTHNNSPCNAAAWLRAYASSNLFYSSLSAKYACLGAGTLVLRLELNKNEHLKLAVLQSAVVEKSANKSADPGPSSVARMSQLAFADFFYEVFCGFLQRYFPNFCKIYLRI